METNLAEVDLLGPYLSVGLFLLQGRCAISLQPIMSNPSSTKVLAEGGRILLCGMDAMRHPFSGLTQHCFSLEKGTKKESKVELR